MDFDLTPEQDELRTAVRAFAEEVVAPAAAEADEREEFPTEIVKRAAELGLFGIPFPEEVGGQGGDLLSFCLCLEEIGRYDSSLAITLEAAVGLAANPMFRFGTDEQQERWLVPMARGEAIGAFALTEPGGGSDARAIRTTAKLDGDGWVIDGSKAFITNSGTPLTSVVIVAALDEAADDGDVSTIVVPVGTPGLAVGRATARSAGARATPTRSRSTGVASRRTTCSANAVAGTRSSSRRSPTAASRSRRSRSGSRADAWRRAFGTRASARRSGGRSARSRRCSSRSPTCGWGSRPPGSRTSGRRGSATAGGRSPPRRRSPSCIASEVAVSSAREAVQVHGGYGFVEDFPVARFYRDAKVLEIGEGTSEIQRVLIARALGLPGTEL